MTFEQAISTIIGIAAIIAIYTAVAAFALIVFDCFIFTPTVKFFHRRYGVKA